MHASVQRHVLSLVCKCIDVRARVFGHDHDAGRSRAGLWRAGRVVAMQEVVEARGMRRV